MDTQSEKASQKTTAPSSSSHKPSVDVEKLQQTSDTQDTYFGSRGNSRNGPNHASAECVSEPSVKTQQKWNEPRGNIARLAASYYSMYVFGTCDAAYGALLPYLQEYYGISYTLVSLVFLVQIAGFSLSALTNSWVHRRLGQRGIAILSPICHVIAFTVFSIHPPWPVFVIFVVFATYGNGLIDAAWSSWTGHMVAGNILEGSLHATYALGCTFSPLIATSLIAQRNLPWYHFYYILAAMSALSLLCSSLTFWSKDGKTYIKEHHVDAAQGSIKTAMRQKVTWLCCFYFLLNVGSEIALGGWIVSFMLDVRHAEEYVAGVVNTGFWAGMTLGRSLLGVVTHVLIGVTNQPTKTGFIYHLRLTERSISTVYLTLAICFQLIFWLIPSVIGSALAVSFLGLFLGPTFPSGIVAATKLLPRDLHIPSIALSTAVGGIGGSIFPFAVGVIAQAKGVMVLQPIILAMLIALLLTWLCFPRIPIKGAAAGSRI